MIHTKKIIRKIFRDLVDFVYPPYCILCEAKLEPENRLVCTSCWERLEPYSTVDTFINQNRIISKYPYSKDMRTIIHNLKYRGKTDLAVNLGRSLGKMIREDKRIKNWDLLIPVPLHRVKKRSRGYNQSELLSDKICDLTAIRQDNSTLVRHRYTKNQAALPIRERADNVKGAFSIADKTNVEGKKIILVDDVITTGSTVSECIRVLKDAGAKEVAALSAAMAVSN